MTGGSSRSLLSPSERSSSINTLLANSPASDAGAGNASSPATPDTTSAGAAAAATMPNPLDLDVIHTTIPEHVENEITSTGENPNDTVLHLSSASASSSSSSSSGSFRMHGLSSPSRHMKKPSIWRMSTQDFENDGMRLKKVWTRFFDFHWDEFDQECKDKYAQALSEAHVKLDDAQKLTFEDLRELGIALGHRRRLIVLFNLEATLNMDEDDPMRSSEREGDAAGGGSAAAGGAGAAAGGGATRERQFSSTFRPMTLKSWPHEHPSDGKQRSSEKSPNPIHMDSYQNTRGCTWIDWYGEHQEKKVRLQRNAVEWQTDFLKAP